MTTLAPNLPGYSKILNTPVFTLICPVFYYLKQTETIRLVGTAESCGRCCFCWKSARFNSKSSDHVTLTYWDVTSLVGQTALLERHDEYYVSSLRSCLPCGYQGAWHQPKACIMWIMCCWFQSSGMLDFPHLRKSPSHHPLGFAESPSWLDCCDWAKAPEPLKSDAQVIDEILHWSRLQLYCYFDPVDMGPDGADSDDSKWG